MCSDHNLTEAIGCENALQVDPEAAAAGAERLRKYRKYVEDLKQQQRVWHQSLFHPCHYMRRISVALPELISFLLFCYICLREYQLSMSWLWWSQMKPDMIAYKERKVELGTPLEVYGQIPGVALGAKFQNKGELAIMGVHTNITGGIYFK